jgi:GNAT superfamily N-acetyltransferase
MFIEVVTEPGVDDMATVEKGVREVGRANLTELPRGTSVLPVGALARAADDSIVGGIKANIFWSGLEVETLWVAEELRGNGAGTKLLDGVEKFARSQGAKVAFVTTVEDCEFFQRHGYEIYGELSDRPVGLSLYHMKKRL